MTYPVGTEVAHKLAADCVQELPCCAQICLAWERFTDLARKPLGQRPRGLAHWIQHKLHIMMRVAATGLYRVAGSDKEAARLQGLARSHREALNAI